MPGKINPVIPEMVNQVAFHVIGMDVAISFAAEAGQLQLNAFEPLMAFGLLQSVTIMRNATAVLRARRVEGIEPDADRCLANLEGSTANFAELLAWIGYDKVSELAKWMLEESQTWGGVLERLRQEEK